jgi:LPXTG-motif cell wall-anchored protein
VLPATGPDLAPVLPASALLGLGLGLVLVRLRRRRIG